MVLLDWIDVFIASLQNLWAQVVSFLPSLLGALIIFVLGLIVAFGLEKLVERVIYYLRVDTILKRAGLERLLDRANINLNAGAFFGKLVYWFMLIAFLLAASDILQFVTLSQFLLDVLSYIPTVIVAALILLVTFVAANFVRGLVRASTLSAELHAGRSLGAIVWWGVTLFGVFTALSELGVAVAIVQTLITGLIAMLAIAGGLAFGLGGRDHADEFISKIREEIANSKK